MKGLVTFAVIVVWASFSSTVMAQSLRLRNDEALIIMTVDGDTYEHQRQQVIMSGQAKANSLAYEYIQSEGIETFFVTIGLFDPTSNRALYKNWNPSPNLMLYGDGPVAARFLIAKVKSGDYAIFSQTLQLHRSGWLYCFDNASEYFHVEPGTYNFVGAFSPFEASLAIAQEVDEGKISHMLPRHDVFELVHGELTGFTPASETYDSARVEMFLKSKGLVTDGPITITQPAVKSTHLIADDKKGCPA